MKKKQKKAIIRKEIQSLYEVAELLNKKQREEVFCAISHLNNALMSFK